MGMCRSCGTVYSALDMKNGFCQECIQDGKVDEVELNKEQEIVLSFEWWTLWAWLSLTIGNVFTYFALKEEIGLAILAIILNIALVVYVLKFNKYAFLMATVLTFNPLLWIINGIYLKNRWHHPKVN